MQVTRLSNTCQIKKPIKLVLWFNSSFKFVLASDLHPLENKEKDESLRNLIKEIMRTTPIYFPDYIVDQFPKLLADFFSREQQQLRNEPIYIDPSNRQYKVVLKKKVEEDYARFLGSLRSSFIDIMKMFCFFNFSFLQKETRPENQNQFNFQSIPNAPINTLIWYVV